MSKLLLANKKALPSREAGQFKELLNLYESRQLKKALKTADAILKKFPEHGETTCMKGLVLVHMGRREEGIDLVKKGVRLDLTSHICWHVLGLIHKGEKNYEEALKSYTQALRFDRENMNILRDAASLQTQLRMYDALVDTRATLLRLRPNVRQNWVALSIAHYLAGNVLQAKQVLEHYLGTLKNVQPHDVEQSETLLYYIHLLESLNEHQEALSILDTNSRSREIVDKTAISETRARLLTALNAPEAPEAWHTLLERNPDCTTYYTSYLSSLSPSSPTETLQTLTSQFPTSTAPRRLLLTHTPPSSPSLPALLRAYLDRAFKKGIPSLFSDLKSLYPSPEKRTLIGETAESLSQSYQDQDPTAHLWSLYFLAHHHSHIAFHYPSPTSSSQALALETVTRALTHTPTLPDLHLLHARILKRAGDLYGAARAAGDARRLDGQDRFLNTKEGVYLCRVGEVGGGVGAGDGKGAEGVWGLFTKKDAPSPGADLEEMQSMLYLLESARGFESIGKVNMALKRYMSVKKIYEEMEDDQYDFHGYCLRKFTLNAYLRMLKWEDNLRLQGSYVTAALGAARILVKAHDDPELVKSLGSSSGSDKPSASASQSSAKKALQKAKKKALAQAQSKSNPTESTADKNSKTDGNEDKGLEPQTSKSDEDPEGMKALGDEGGMERAWGFLKPLVRLFEEEEEGAGTAGAGAEDKEEEKEKASVNMKGREREVEIWLAVYDVCVRRAKYLRALGALERAARLVRLGRATPDELHVRIVDLKMRAPQILSSSLPPSSTQHTLFLEGLARLYPAGDGLALETYNTQYLQTHCGGDGAPSASAVLAVARAMQVMGAPEGERDEVVFGVRTEGRFLSVKDALAAWQFLREVKSARAEEFRAACDGDVGRFGLATVFRSEEEKGRLRVGLGLDCVVVGGGNDDINAKEGAEGKGEGAAAAP